MKKKKIIKTFLQAFSRILSWIFLSCIIYRTSTDHALINYVLLKFEIDYLSDKISFQSTKKKKNHKKEELDFNMAYFSIPT